MIKKTRKAAILRRVNASARMAFLGENALRSVRLLHTDRIAKRNASVRLQRHATTFRESAYESASRVFTVPSVMSLVLRANTDRIA